MNTVASALDRKCASSFEGLVVDKRAALHAGLRGIPRFVAEYLIGSARSRNAGAGLDDVVDRIQRFAVDADRRDEFVSRLMREGRGRLIALLEVHPYPERNTHVGYVTQLDGHELAVDDALVERHPELLYGGLWGSAELTYDTNGSKPVLRLSAFEPYQLTSPDLDRFRAARASFTDDEWIDLLIRSCGYEPSAFGTRRLKLLLLTRLVPLVQGSVNLVELGPRNTGKSFLLRNLNAHTYLLAGARATPASLLYDLRRRELGIIGRKKVVVFDEIGATQFPDRSLVANMKDYMESGTIARGGRSFHGDCSLVFAGNVDLDGSGAGPASHYGHLFEVFPPELCDSALVDRIHALIPGWELPKITDDVLATGVGLLSDYFGEVMQALRRDHWFLAHLDQRIELENATIRDATAIKRVASGLLKLLYPNREIPEDGLRDVLHVAVELRQRVHEQLVAMAPGEYRPKCIFFEGMPDHVAADLRGRSAILAADVKANQLAQVGVVTLLLVSDRGGGDVGFVECAQVAGSGVHVTGLSGPVLRHSAVAAYGAVQSLAASLGVSADRLRRGRLVLHLRDMALAKEGPSAGLAFGLAMISAVTGWRVRPGVAVTGELSVHGNVDPIGGVLEKIAAAQRHGRTRVIIPAENAAELQRVPHLSTKIEVCPVRTLEEALPLVLAIDADARRAS